MPAPGTLGRLLPLAWLITAIVHDGGRESASARSLLGLFVVLSFTWASSPILYFITSTSALLPLFPSLFEISRRRFGILMAMLPLVPLILVLVPFTGDEPHYARITENLYPGSNGDFAVFARQSGDPVEGMSHHQSLYPALMLPGYPMGQWGLRTVNLVFAAMAAWLLSLLLRDSGYGRWKQLSLLGIVLLPGGAALGLVYPGWFAVGILLFGVLGYRRGGGKAWMVFLASLLLVAVKIRFLGVSAGLMLALLMETRGRRKWLVPVVILLLAAGGLLFDLLFLEGRVFWVRYGNSAFLRTLLVQPLYRLPELLSSMLSTILDTESGLLWRAPWVVAALAGIPVLRREDRSLFRWLAMPALMYLLFLIYWSGYNWAGMPTPAGRMLLPVVPLLVASLGKVWDHRGTKLLVWISMAIAAAHFCHPLLRFNQADGTDVMTGVLAGPVSAIYGWLPSSVRLSASIYAVWTFLVACSAVLIYRKSRYSELFMGSVLAVVCLAAASERNTWEAEDLPANMVSGCRLYPRDGGTDHRKYWMFSRERMLMMEGEADRVILPLPSGRDTVRVEIGLRTLSGDPPAGLQVRCGSWADTVYASSSLMQPPAWSTLIRDVVLEERPENMSEERCELLVPVTCDSLVIAPAEPGRTGAVYLDFISLD